MYWINADKFINSDEFVDVKGFYLRENIQEKKVYIYDAQEEINKEFTYCDFSLNVGDEVTNIYSLDNPFIFKIESINNTSSYNQKKEYYLNESASHYIEGVGKFNFPFESYDINYVLGNSGSEIFCHGNKENQNNCTETIDPNYEPMLKEGSFWDVNTSTPGDCGHRNIRYMIGNDTIINNKTYRKLKAAEFEKKEENCPTYKIPLILNPNNFKELKFLFLREEVSEKKVYVWSFEESSNQYKEFTLYDFSLDEEENMTNVYFGD